MFKIKLDEFLSRPVHTSAFVVLFALLSILPIIRLPIPLSLLLLGGLVYLSMYFGAVFKTKDESSSGP